MGIGGRDKGKERITKETGSGLMLRKDQEIFLLERVFLVSFSTAEHATTVKSHIGLVTLHC